MSYADEEDESPKSPEIIALEGLIAKCQEYLEEEKMGATLDTLMAFSVKIGGHNLCATGEEDEEVGWYSQVMTVSQLKY